MCGIVGVINLMEQAPVELSTVERMLGMIRHRGPDEFGVYRDRTAALGSARLSIIDLTGGGQPIGNETERFWIVFNGEIFNYLELRTELESRGHRFKTRTDTEVILHLYEDHGEDCLRLLNGQFALAIWDAQESRLFLARDRLGVRPLFYTIRNGRLIFGSEIKAIFAHADVAREIDPASLAQIFTYWSVMTPRTAFRNIYEIPPGYFLVSKNGRQDVRSYWSLQPARGTAQGTSDGELAEELGALLLDACRIRLRADVPVGAYLSGGLDSSLTAAMVRRHFTNRLETFSIAFENPDFDESRFQFRMARHLETRHRIVRCAQSDVAECFPKVVWHAETPILRTAPAPMFLLSRLVNRHRFKVVMTGEGADEFLGGYDIFKEMKIRRFWARNPESELRPLLLRRLYKDIAAIGRTSQSFLTAFYRRALGEVDSPYYSHLVRWGNAARTRRFLRDHEENNLRFDESVPLPQDFHSWDRLQQAQFLEVKTFLSQYLLSSQGDRMAMAHSVEGRFPFLDHRVVEFAFSLPSAMKLRGLNEKWLLKRIGKRYLPHEIWSRPKKPYRAPVHRSFFPDPPDYVRELLATSALEKCGLFHAVAVGQLVDKAERGLPISEVEDMALAGILSTQLLDWQFVRDFPMRARTRLGRIRVKDFTHKLQAS